MARRAVERRTGHRALAQLVIPFAASALFLCRCAPFSDLSVVWFAVRSFELRGCSIRQSLAFARRPHVAVRVARGARSPFSARRLFRLLGLRFEKFRRAEAATARPAGFGAAGF